MKKKRLEMILERVEPLEEPNVDLEQYPTPAPIAAEILYGAMMDEHIVGNNILDLGCGSGVFTLGAALLGAGRVVGVDVDPEALSKVRENMIETGAPEVVGLFLSDVKDYKPGLSFDTCVMNPPFGAQKKGADRPFLEKAMELSRTIYSLHMTRTEDFIERFVKERGARVISKSRYRFPIPHLFHFHSKMEVDVEVTCFRIECGG